MAAASSTDSGCTESIVASCSRWQSSLFSCAKREPTAFCKKGFARPKLFCFHRCWKIHVASCQPCIESIGTGLDTLVPKARSSSSMPCSLTALSSLSLSRSPTCTSELALNGSSLSAASKSSPAATRSAAALTRSSSFAGPLAFMLA